MFLSDLDGIFKKKEQIMAVKTFFSVEKIFFAVPHSGFDKSCSLQQAI